MGDLKTKIKQWILADVIGGYGLTEQNESDDILLQFCNEENSSVFWHMNPPPGKKDSSHKCTKL